MDKKELATASSSIGKHESKHIPSSSKSSVGTSVTTTVDQRHIIQNFRLIWLNANIDESKDDFHSSIQDLRRNVNTIDIFTDADRCVDFLTEIIDEQVFMIMSGALGQHIIPHIHDVPQLSAIFVLCRNKSRHEQWANDWSKVKGVFTETAAICEKLGYTARQCDEGTISISFVSVSEASSQDLNQLDQSFMYTQILKEILFEIEYDEQSIKTFTTYCRQQYADNDSQLNSIIKFEQEYRHKGPIWWYTCECFLYSMLNRALRMQEVNTIMRMGFFIGDLHRHIEQLHSEQFSASHASFTVYRGQGLSIKDFERLITTKGGLMSFNNFLSTSKDRDMSFAFADSNRGNPDLIGILFKMTIHPSISTTPFALINDISNYQSEQEILFTMHTVFRIGEATNLDQSNRFWQVELELTSDRDSLLDALTDCIRKETDGEVGWDRLGKLTIRIGQFDKAEEVFRVLLDQNQSNDTRKSNYYHHLGCIKAEQGDYVSAISFYEKSLEVGQKTLPPDHLTFAVSYGNIGSVYYDMNESWKALSFFEKSLEIQKKSLPENHPAFAISYNNIGSVYDAMGEYSTALSFYEKSLDIRQKTLPQNHPSFAISYNSLASIYDNMHEYSKALSFYEASLKIRQKVLPPNHPSLVIPYNNIGLMYNNMGEYSKALLFYQKSLDLLKETHPPNHPSLVTSYNNIGLTYNNMNKHSEALSFYENALEIAQKALPPDHLAFATSYCNIGRVHEDTGEYSRALSFYEKALEIQEKSLPPNHPSLATLYGIIASVYYNLCEYAKAVLFHEKALDIFHKTLPKNHMDLDTLYNNIGMVYDKMGEHSKALSSYEKSLEIKQKILPPNHSSLANSYCNIGNVYEKMGEYSKAVSSFEHAFEIDQRSLPENHRHLKLYRRKLESLRKNL